MFSQSFPQVNDLVVAKITTISDLAVYVTLPEYGDMEGMILLSEVSRRRFRTAKNQLSIGKLECCAVVRIDEKKGYVDLSKRRVSAELAMQTMSEFQRRKVIHQTLILVAKELEQPIRSFYEHWIWSIDNELDPFDMLTVFLETSFFPFELSSEEFDALRIATEHYFVSNKTIYKKPCEILSPDGIHAMKTFFQQCVNQFPHWTFQSFGAPKICIESTDPFSQDQLESVHQFAKQNNILLSINNE